MPARRPRFAAAMVIAFWFKTPAVLALFSLAAVFRGAAHQLARLYG